MEYEATHDSSKVLIIGSANHTRLVTAYEWHQLPYHLNVSDFDVLILNFKPLQDAEYSQRVKGNTLPTLQQFLRLVFSEGSEIIAIGNPNVRVGNSAYGSTWWLPIEFNFVYESGEEIRKVKPAFESVGFVRRCYRNYGDCIFFNQTRKVKIFSEPKTNPRRKCDVICEVTRDFGKQDHYMSPATLTFETPMILIEGYRR